ARPDSNPAIKVIDADTHLTEPHDMWLKRAPAKFRDRVPQVKMHHHPTRAPEHGEHTESALLDLGLSWEDIAALKQGGAIG
ncbi:MAG: hypothetical protein ABIM50_00405, partial [Novosphingobium sp.]